MSSSVKLAALLCFLPAISSRNLAAAPNLPPESPPATYGAWHSCSIGGGGYIQDVVLCPTNPLRIYAYVDVGGVFRSDDGGQRWKMLHGSMPTGTGYEIRSLIVDPRDDRNLLIAAGSQGGPPSGVWRSTDAGETWHRVLAAPFWGNADYRWAGVLLARDPRNPDVVLTASIQEGVYRSTDNGRTWTKCGAEGLYPTDIRYDHSNPQRVWLCAQREKGWFQGSQRSWTAAFLSSEDGGQTWRKGSDVTPSETLQDPVDPAVLYGIVDERPQRSADSGVTWQPIDAGLPPPGPPSSTSESRFNALAAGPDFVLTASTKGTFYRLPHGASQWQKIRREGYQEIYEGREWFHHSSGQIGSALASIVVDPRNAAHWFFTDWFAVYQTWDSGAHWTLTIDGMEVTVIHCLQQDPSNPQTVYLGMADNGFFYSEDGGRRFDNDDWTKGITNNIKCITVSPANPRRLYAVGPQTWEWEANQVFVSDDRGRTWTRSPMTGLPDMKQHHCNSIAVDPKNPDLVYLCVSQAVGPGEGGVYRSTDAGRTWNWMGAGLPMGQAFFSHDIWGVGREIAVGSDGTVVCLSRSRGEVYHYDPGSAAWVKSVSSIDPTLNCVVADLHTPGRYYLAAGGVYRSDDGARTWQRLRAGGYASVWVDMVHPERVAAGSSNGVILSEDSGQTWKALDPRLPYRSYDLVCFAGDHLVVGTGGNGAFWMDLSSRPAATATWTPQKPQYIFLNRAPGQDWNQNRPQTIQDSLFTDPMNAVGAASSGGRRLGLSFVLSYLAGPPAAIEQSLNRILTLAEQHDVPVLIALDGENWWGYRSDLWNWWDPAQPGFNPRNAENVEWTDWSPRSALKIAWRNWGRQIRVLPPPNLGSPRFRHASEVELTRLAAILHRWANQLPPDRRFLFPGVKIGWEASIGVNAYYYPNGNRYLEQYPSDPSHDPKTDLQMDRNFAGGLAPLGYAAVTSLGWKHPGPVTLPDQERVTADYLAFLARRLRQVGFSPAQVFTHAGGQFPPWNLHYSHRVAINADSTPGWSLYFRSPAVAGDLGQSLANAHRSDWCAAEWLPAASTAAQWQAAINDTLNFQQCHFLSIYNWGGIRTHPEAIAGIRAALAEASG